MIGQDTRRQFNSEDRAMIERLARGLAAIPDVAFAYLFGSRVTGRARAESDVDLAVMLRGDLAGCPAHDRIGALAPVLVPLVGDGLDLVFLDEVGPLLAHRILRDGLLLDDKDPVTRVEFYVKTVGTYLDTQPMRELHILETKRRAREGRKVGRPWSARATSARPGGA